MPIPVGAPVVETPLGPGRPGQALQPPSLTLGDVTLGVVDDVGVKWTLGSIKGWFEPADLVEAQQQRANDHGVWISPTYYGGRLVEVEGGIEAGTWDGALEAFARLSSAVSLSELQTLYVSDGRGTLQAQVRRGGEILPTFGESPRVIEFSLALLAPDPRRYSVEVTTVSTGMPATSGGLTLPTTVPFSIGATVTSGIVTAVNVGNMSTRPVFTVHGPAPAGSIVHRASGRALRWHEPIAAGRTLVIDTDRRRALLDGTAPRTITGTWFDYAPGVNEVAFTAATYNADAVLVSEHRSAFR